jgi:hypothetical protein
MQILVLGLHYFDMRGDLWRAHALTHPAHGAPHSVALRATLGTQRRHPCNYSAFAPDDVTAGHQRPSSALVDHPVALPEIGINLFWHAKFHREPGNQWLRGVIFDTFPE